LRQSLAEREEISRGLAAGLTLPRSPRAAVSTSPGAGTLRTPPTGSPSATGCPGLMQLRSGIESSQTARGLSGYGWWTAMRTAIVVPRCRLV
jgi:hypothetical protein